MNYCNRIEVVFQQEGVPYCAGNNNGKEVLPFSNNTPLFVQLHVQRPTAVKPLSLEIAPKAYRARSVSV